MNITTSSGSNRGEVLNLINRPKLFNIPEKCFEKAIGCAWSSGNKFSVYPRSQTVSKSPKDDIETKILNIRQEILLFHPILRKLVNESNGTYLSLQKVVETAKNNDSHVEFLKLSRQYRSIIRVCVENLQEAVHSSEDGNEMTTLQSYITIFYSIECIWHLCEILYIDKIPGDIVLPYLLEWVRFHFPCHEQTAAQLLEACERGSEEHDEYWDTVVGMIVQGRVDVARALLRLNSLSETNEFKLVDNSLRSMPVYSIYDSISTGEFMVTWKHWQAECRAKVTSRILASQPKLELLMRLITGEYSAFESIRSTYTSWFDMLGGYVMFTAPWSRTHELSTPASACAGMGSMPTGSRLDRTLRALLEGDMHQVIHEIQHMADNGWFATHLTDILFHCGKLRVLDKHQTDVTQRLRDSLILEYGTLIMEHKSLWPVGLSYLASCPPEGPHRAQLLLERIPLDTEAKAMRVIAEANKYGLVEVGRTICGVLSSRAVGRGGGRGAALVWAVRGCGAGRGAGRGAGDVAALCLRHYTRTGSLPAPDVLLTAGSALLIDDTLLFLGKYCEFHRLYKNKEFHKAAQLLISLITSKIAPDFFWETLLLDALPLLESDEAMFTADDTYDMMLCLELRTQQFNQDKAELLRLALLRNLARTALTQKPDPQV